MMCRQGEAMRELEEAARGLSLSCIQVIDPLILPLVCIYREAVDEPLPAEFRQLMARLDGIS